jgi:hypothetical protein
MGKVTPVNETPLSVHRKKESAARDHLDEVLVGLVLQQYAADRLGSRDFLRPDLVVDLKKRCAHSQADGVVR